MNIETKKYELIEWLTQVHDEDLLEQLEMVRDSWKEKNWYANLSDEQKESIERGLKDSEEGRVTPHEVVMKEMREKYGL